MQGLRLSSIGLGSYLGNMDEATDDGYIRSTLAALQGGINCIDTSLNYRNQSSERNIGAALGQAGLRRDEFAVCTKAGYLVPNAVPGSMMAPGDVVGGMHCMTPDFLEDQLNRSRSNLGLEAIDVFYLHNPETQLSYVPQEEFYSRVRLAFERLESLAADGRLAFYGAATWSGFRTQPSDPKGLSLIRMEAIAQQVAGAAHRFRFIQLPFNLGMLEGLSYLRESGASVIAAANDLGITTVASASLLQARLSNGLPEELAAKIPGFRSDAQRALQFARSAPGVSVALVGMSNPAHVAENLHIASVAPADLSAWFSKTR